MTFGRRPKEGRRNPSEIREIERASCAQTFRATFFAICGPIGQTCRVGNTPSTGLTPPRGVARSNTTAAGRGSDATDAVQHGADRQDVAAGRDRPRLRSADAAGVKRRSGSVSRRTTDGGGSRVGFVCSTEIGGPVFHVFYLTPYIIITYNFICNRFPLSYPSFVIRCPRAVKTLCGRVDIVDHRDDHALIRRCGVPSPPPRLSPNDDRAAASDAYAWRADRGTREPNRRAGRSCTSSGVRACSAAGAPPGRSPSLPAPGWPPPATPAARGPRPAPVHRPRRPPHRCSPAGATIRGWSGGCSRSPAERNMASTAGAGRPTAMKKSSSIGSKCNGSGFMRRSRLVSGAPVWRGNGSSRAA